MSRETPEERKARRARERYQSRVDDVVRSVRREAHFRGRSVGEELSRRARQWPGDQVWADAAEALGVTLEVE